MDDLSEEALAVLISYGSIANELNKYQLEKYFRCNHHKVQSEQLALLSAGYLEVNTTEFTTDSFSAGYWISELGEEFLECLGDDVLLASAYKPKKLLKQCLPVLASISGHSPEQLAASHVISVDKAFSAFAILAGLGVIAPSEDGLGAQVTIAGELMLKSQKGVKPLKSRPSKVLYSNKGPLQDTVQPTSSKVQDSAVSEPTKPKGNTSGVRRYK